MKAIASLLLMASLALAGSVLISCAPVATTAGAQGTASSSATSRLKLSNTFYKPIVVRLERLGDTGHRDVLVPARSSESLRVPSGTYKYSAAAKGFRPISQYKQLDPGRGYTLYF